MYITSQARSQGFLCVCVWGGGGGGVPQEPGPNLLMLEWYAMQVPKIHRAEWPTNGLTEMGSSFNSIGKKAN